MSRNLILCRLEIIEEEGNYSFLIRKSTSSFKVVSSITTRDHELIGKEISGTR